MTHRSQRPLGIDLFSGAGGLSLGFEQAGFDVVAAVEIDPIHAAVHQFNFPHCATLAESATTLTGTGVRSAAGLKNRPIDVVFGGAPCQGFSLMGQRALDDPRNALVRDFVRLVVELDASTFVFENVKGLTVGNHRQFLLEVIEAFDTVGYAVRTPWRVLNASAYGVPQDRQRLILMGAKKGNNLPDYPDPLTYPASRPSLGLRPGPSCFDALKDLPDAEDYAELLERDWVITENWDVPSVYASALRGETSEEDYSHPRRWNPNVLTSSMRTNHSEISRRRFAETPPGQIEPISRFFRLPAWGISNTLRAGTDSARGAFTSPRPIHYEKPRCITVREMARLHGFPDWFRFHQTKWHGARQVGNAVPPPLARAVAGQIRESLRISPLRPSDPIALGEPNLLLMDMAQASDYFGITQPKWKRNLKSGARKRKQADIEAERQAPRFSRG